jgi:hypothetical protein
MSDCALLSPLVVDGLRRGWFANDEDEDRSSCRGVFGRRDCSGFGTPVALSDMFDLLLLCIYYYYFIFLFGIDCGGRM